MYFTLTFDIDETLHFEEKEELKNFVKDCVSLKNNHWVKPLSNLYIVGCNNESDRKIILDNLMVKSKSLEGKMRFMMSPLINAGHFSGYAEKELWEHIKRVTNKDLYGLY